MRSFAFLFLVCLIMSVNGYSQDVMTLKQAIEVGLENNYSIQIARNNEEIAKNSNTLGYAGFLPQLNLNYNNTSNITNSRVELASGQVRTGTGVNNNNQTASALVNWTLFDGLNMFVNKSKLEEFQKQGEYQTRMQIENTVSLMVVNYFAIVQQEKMLVVIKEAIELSNERLKLAQAMKAIGTSSESAVLQATVDANADSTRYLQQLALIQNTKSDLNRIMARDVQTPFNVSYDLTVSPDLKFETLKPLIEKQNSQLLVSKTNVNVADYTIDNYRSIHFPSVSVFGGYNYSRSVSPLGAAPLARSNGLQYGVTASFNIFNGGITNTNIQNARIQHKSSQMQYEDLKLTLQSELNKQYNNYTMNLKLIALQRTNVEAAKKDVAIAIGRYKLGNISDIDMRVTQQKLIDAENSLLIAEYTAKQSEIELLRLSGQLIDASF